MAATRYYVHDATVTQTESRFRGLAAKYLDWEIRRCGGIVVTDPLMADVVVATMLSPQEWKSLPNSLRRIGVRPERDGRHGQTVVLGGQAATSPAVFDSFVDVACVGEGRKFIETMVGRGLSEAKSLPNAWVPGEPRQVFPDPDFPWDAPPIKGEDGIVRIFASRGCQKKCLFCHTGWSNVYQENDQDRLLSQYESLTKAGYKVNVVTNDAPALSFFDELTVLDSFSASYSQTREMLERGVGNLVGRVKSIRFGVETPSSRLRGYVGKPIDTAKLFDVSTQLLNAGIGVRWFMIAGMPGERDDDYDEIKDVILRAKRDIAKGALQISFTAFCPDASAPLCIAPLTDDYWPRFERFWKWFFEDVGFTRRVQLFRCAAPKSRMEHAVGSMGAIESELRRGWLDRDPPNWRVAYPYRAVARKAFEVYAKRAGLSLAVGV